MSVCILRIVQFLPEFLLQNNIAIGGWTLLPWWPTFWCLKKVAYVWPVNRFAINAEQILLVVKAWPVSLPLITGFHPPDPRSWHRVREQRGDSSAAPRSTGGCCVCFVFQFPIDSNSTVPRLHLLPPASCHSHKQSLVGDKTLVFPLPDSLCPMSKCPLIMSKFI